MKLFIILSLSLSLNIALAQEVIIEDPSENLILQFLIDQDELNKLLIAKSNELQLGVGKWTNIDRKNNTLRFKNAMNFIVVNNRTDLLSDFTQISAYYKYLDDLPLVKNNGIKWQKAAANVTDLLQLMPVSVVVEYFSGQFYTELAQLINPDDSEYLKRKKILDEGISPKGLDFIDGTASKRIVADITKNFYSPLVKEGKKIDDPFVFDANAVYREQYIVLQPTYYNNFNEFDKRLIVGLISEISAKILALDIDLSETDLTIPKNRLYLGLMMMGYPEKKINEYISKIK